MWFRRYFKFLFVIFFIIISTSDFANAGPPGPLGFDATFAFSKEQLGLGKWNFYVIHNIVDNSSNNLPFPYFSATDQQKISKAIDDYRYYKRHCGAKNTFYEVIYEMPAEERKRRGCVINGTYQNVFCFKTETNKQECRELVPWKIDYRLSFTFESYLISYFYDIKECYDDTSCYREVSSCSVRDDFICTMHFPNPVWYKYPKNYSVNSTSLIVLDNLDSDEGFYVSDYLSGVFDFLFSSTNDICNQTDGQSYDCRDIELKPDLVLINESKKLVISLTEKSDKESDTNWIKKLFRRIVNYFQ